MTEFLVNSLTLFITEKCYDNYFVDYNFLDVDCFKLILSKGLGLGIIAGSILVKVPQIAKIWGAKSAEGISLFSVLLDLFAITCHLSYSVVSNFPFSAFGDSAFLAIQTAIIAFLCLHYSGSTFKALVFAAGYCIICYVAMGGTTPREVLLLAQGFNIPILLVGKLSQALVNYKNGSTGQLSAVTCFMLFFGSMARIFTSIQETGDTMMITTYVASTSANAVIVAQLLYYWKSGKDADVKKKQKVKAKSKKAE